MVDASGRRFSSFDCRVERRECQAGRVPKIAINLGSAARSPALEIFGAIAFFPRIRARRESGSQSPNNKLQGIAYEPASRAAEASRTSGSKLT